MTILLSAVCSIRLAAVAGTHQYTYILVQFFPFIWCYITLSIDPSKRSDVKCKYHILPITKKWKCWKPHCGVSVESIWELHGNGSSSVYDIKIREKTCNHSLLTMDKKGKCVWRNQWQKQKVLNLANCVIQWFTVFISIKWLRFLEIYLRNKQNSFTKGWG